MTTRKQKTPPTPPAPPYEPTDYELGVLDTLEALRQEVSRLSDAKRTAERLLWESSPEVQSLLNFASPAVNIAGDVENRVTKRMMARLTEKRTKP